MSPLKYFFFPLAVFALLGCDSNPVESETTDKGLSDLIISESLILNPTGYTPLSAELKLQTAQTRSGRTRNRKP